LDVNNRGSAGPASPVSDAGRRGRSVC